MKDTQFNELIKGKDLTKPEDAKAILEAFNKEINDTVAKKEGSFKESFEALKKENDSLKANNDLSTKQMKELNEKLTEANKQNDSLNKRAWIYQNINSKMTDEDLTDFNAMVNSRMVADSNLRYEDVAKDVAKKRGFVKSDIAPAPVAQTVIQSSPVNKPTEKPADVWKSWTGK